MGNEVKKGMQLLLAAVFLASTLILVKQHWDKAQGEDAYESARELAAQASAPAGETEGETPETTAAQETGPVWVPAPIPEDDPYAAELLELDIPALQAENPEVLGWIYLPDSQIDYPILQGEDNEYYLTHTWDKQYNTVGSIFLEYQNSPDLTDFNTIVYGHNMGDGSMFADVSRFMTQWFFDSHPYIYIATPEGIFRYEVFAAYKAPVDSPVYGLSFNQGKTRRNFLAYARENSAVESGIEPGLNDRILTLSTCTGFGYDSRWVVQARLPMVRE